MPVKRFMVFNFGFWKWNSTYKLFASRHGITHVINKNTPNERMEKMWQNAKKMSKKKKKAAQTTATKRLKKKQRKLPQLNMIITFCICSMRGVGVCAVFLLFNV